MVYYVTQDNLNAQIENAADLKNRIRACSEEMDKIDEELKREQKKYEMQLKEMDEELNAKMSFISNSQIVDIIVVDHERNRQISNGIVDLNRDILMKLIRIVKDNEKIKNIIGMGTIFLTWSKLRIFRWARESCYRFLPNSCGKDVKMSGMKFIFSASFFRTFFMNQKMCGGVWTGVFEASGRSDSYSNGNFFGLASATVASQMSSRFLGGIEGSCMFGSLCVYVGGNYNDAGTLFHQSGKNTITLEYNCGNTKETRLPNKTETGTRMETRTKKGTLNIFVEGQLKPHYVNGIPPSVYMGFTGYRDGVIELKQFQRLTAPTVSPSYTGKSYMWK